MDMCTVPLVLKSAIAVNKYLFVLLLFFEQIKSLAKTLVYRQKDQLLL